MTLKPLSGYVLVEIEDNEGKKVGDYLMPDSTQDKPAKGRVISVGNAVRTSGMNIPAPENLQDKIVVFARWKENPIKDGDRNLALVRFEDLQGYYED